MKTVNTIGDFNFKNKEVEDTFKYKPNWANISLMISLGLAILSSIALLINNTISFLFTGISISLYIGSAYYLYHLSNYVLVNEKDIKKHNSLLKGMFVNLKTSFVFWNINISFWLTSIIIKTISLLGANPNWVGEIEPDNVYQVIMFILVIFGLFFFVLYVFFRKIYKKLELKYLELTKEEELSGYLNIFKNFGNKGLVKKTLITFCLLGYLAIITFRGFDINVNIGSVIFTIKINSTNNFGAFIAVLLLVFIVLSSFTNKIKTKQKLIVLIIVDILIGLINYFYLVSKHREYITEAKYSLIRIIAFSIAVIILLSPRIIKKIKNKRTIK